MIQVIISTMFLENYQMLLKKMNISTDVVIIDQCNYEKQEFRYYNNHKVEIFHTTERGLSKSRNHGIRNSTADILIFADDDFRYSDDYERQVLDLYEKYSDADLIIFGAIRNDDYQYKVFPNGKFQNRYRFNVNSIRITARRKSILRKRMFFDERFGTGTEISNGEDTIFMCDCVRKKMRIYSADYVLCRGIKENRESTWWHGYDEKFFEDRGLVYDRISKFSFILKLYFLIKKYSYYKNDISFINAFKSMFFSHRCIKGKEE